MKQAIQLEIQWQEPCTAAPSAIDRLEISAARVISRLRPMIILFARATFFVFFCFALMFLTAIIGG